MASEPAEFAVWPTFVGAGVAMTVTRTTAIVSMRSAVGAPGAGVKTEASGVTFAAPDPAQHWDQRSPLSRQLEKVVGPAGLEPATKPL